MITKQQYRKLMSTYQETGNVTLSALKADMSRPTARKYLEAAQPPSELQAKHTWRTRADPLAEMWPQAEVMLEEAPDLEAKALFEYWLERWPGAAQEKHLRTFQRRVKLWRLQYGPDKEVFFPQDWEPGRAMQLDWTNANELAITIGGQPYEHLLCHSVLPHSNWEWATGCLSESLLSLRQGLQEALHRLGKVPRELRVDNSSAATHRVGGGATGREFNEQFVSLCEYYGLVPRTIGINCPNENGDVESSNGHLKRRLRQHLLLRGSRDFESEAAYECFLEQVLARRNQGRREKLGEELAVMKPLPPTRLSEYDEVTCRVGSASTIRVKKVGYSVPARLIGQELKVEVYERQLKLYSGRELLLSLPRHCGGRGVVLNYRHVIDHLLRKPGAFERYRYREQLFPNRSFREAYDRLVAQQGQRRGAVEYLRLLKLASEVGESDVEVMLADLLSPPYPAWSVEELRRILQPNSRPQIQLAELQPECSSYDALLDSRQEVVYAG
ncbi:MAG: IS21 family transposase [Chloroflexi bacterium]|nr:IS21 family transposase [Chloroflexota bacterium]